MSFELGAAGQGASEGLDKALQRIFLQQQLAEQQRHSQETESQGRENLRQEGMDREAQADDRKQQALSRKAATDAAFQKEIDSRNRDDEENFQAEKLSNSSDPMDKKMGAFLRLRRLSPQGAIPADLFKSDSATAPSTQQKTYKLTDPNLAKQFGLKVGDTIDADYVPGKGTSPAGVKFRGVDVTNGVQHYEKPPTPDRVLVQSGNDYITREEARRRLQAGGEVPLPTTSTTRTMSEGASMLRPHIQEVSNMADELDKAGLFGPAMSRVRQIATKVGSIDDFYDAVGADPELKKDPLVGKFATSLGLLATGAGRVHGGARGGGSPQMFQHFKEMLGDSSTADMFKGRLSAVDDFMKGYAAGPGGKAGAPPPAQGIRYDMNGKRIGG